MKWLAVLCLIVVLEVPGMVWYRIPAHEREQIKINAVVEEMRKLACMGFCKFKFYELDNRETLNHEIHVEPVNEIRL